MTVVSFARRFVMEMAHRKQTMGYKWYIPYGTGWAVNGHEAYLNAKIMNDGEHFIDVGAHIGRWSIPATKYFDHVSSFEPTPRINRVLRVNVALNKLEDRVRVYQMAVSDTSGPSEFWIYDTQGGANSRLEHHLGLSGVEKVKIWNTTLDNYPRADTIKIDTEGWEYHVLKGGKRQLNGHPKLVVELHDMANLDPILRLLDSFSYQKINHYPIPGYPDIMTLVAE